jgi:hypothetical protein
MSSCRNRDLPVHKIISGGQTGVDRAALDVALSLGIDHGGWCPHGRRAEDGVIAPRYRLTETESSDYAVRTKRNVEDSDATLILARGTLTSGTELTCKTALRCEKPCAVVDLDGSPDAESVREWLRGNAARVLNVAGPRESTSPGVYEAACEFLRELLSEA